MRKTCQICRQPIVERPIREDQSQNGVKVIVFRFKNGSTVVDASCQCFGTTFRLHSNERCPLLQRLRAEDAQR
jgi:hypothetical protein